MDIDTIQFFEKMPEVVPLYEAVKNKILDSLEDVTIKVQKSQISFSHHKNFAYIWLPIRKMKNRPKTYVILTFSLNYRIQSPRIVESVEPYLNHWTHHIIIQNASELDDEIIDWLHQAYIFAQRR